MAGSLLPQPKQLFQDANWNPLIGGQIFTYAAGTLTPKTTYQDAALTIANTNPALANARGEILMFGTGAYRVILKDAAGSTIYDVDNIEGARSISDAVRSDLAAPNGASLVGSATWYGATVINFDATKVPDGATVVFSGRATPHDGGGGSFTYVKSSTQTVDDGLVFAASDNGRFIRNGWTIFGFNGPASVAFWGASADPLADNGGHARAVAAANALPQDLQLLPGIAGIAAPLNLSTKWKLLGGKVSTLRALVAMASVLTIGSGLLGSDDSSASNYQLGSIDGVTVDGNAMATNCIIYGGGTYNVTGYQTSNCKIINAIGDGTKTLNNFFVNQFYGTSFNNNGGNGFRLGAGNNSGENISFYGCGFFNNGLSGFFSENSGPGGASISFYGCSFDYNQNWGIENGTTQANATVISVFGGHIENAKQYALNYGTLNFTDTLFAGGTSSATLGYLIDNQGGMSVRGGWVQNGGSGAIFNPNSSPVFTYQVINVPTSYPLTQVGSTGTLIAGQVYQNKTGSYLELSVPFSFGVGVGRVQGFIGAVAAAFLVASRNGNTSGIEEYMTIRIPPFYFYQINVSGSAGLSGGHIYSYG